MMITPDLVAEKLGAYLRHEISLDTLVDWAEQAMLDGEFSSDRCEAVGEVVARLGLADVRAFGLTWEDCEALLALLGYEARVEIVAP